MVATEFYRISQDFDISILIYLLKSLKISDLTSISLPSISAEINQYLGSCWSQSPTKMTNMATLQLLKTLTVAMLVLYTLYHTLLCGSGRTIIRIAIWLYFH